MSHEIRTRAGNRIWGLLLSDREDEIEEADIRAIESEAAALAAEHTATLDVERLRIAYEAGKVAADFEDTLAQINATMEADTTELVARLAAQDRSGEPQP